jgi:Ser/Thr protein kinase RdoA (MazF antagonist)
MQKNPSQATQQVLSVVSSTLAGDAIAHAVEEFYPVGMVSRCHLARRGFNHVYELLLQDGRRCVARLSSHRPRGAPNTAYEAALLDHLKAAGACVAAPWRTRDGATSAPLHVAEGTRSLMVFDFLQGDPPGKVLADVQAMGQGLAHLHSLSQSYEGPESLYRLELPHLLHKPLQWLLAAPTMDAALQASFSAVGQRLAQRMNSLQGLSLVACHGDCHGGNSFVSQGGNGLRVASFFDFDDAGPGYLAYDLAVYWWGMQMDTGTALAAEHLACWQHFLQGYRSVQAIAQADFDAISLFVPVRHLWLLGERAHRTHEWGSQALPQVWLRKQVELLTAWETLATPV